MHVLLLLKRGSTKNSKLLTSYSLVYTTSSLFYFFLQNCSQLFRQHFLSRFDPSGGQYFNIQEPVLHHPMSSTSRSGASTLPSKASTPPSKGHYLTLWGQYLTIRGPVLYHSGASNSPSRGQFCAQIKRISEKVCHYFSVLKTPCFWIQSY